MTTNAKLLSMAAVHRKYGRSPHFWAAELDAGRLQGRIEQKIDGRKYRWTTESDVRDFLTRYYNNPPPRLDYHKLDGVR